MAETVQEFLKKIGPRRLTDAEARQLHLLRLQEGHRGKTGVIEILANRAAASKAKSKSEDDKNKS